MERWDRLDKVFQFFQGQGLGHLIVLSLQMGLISINTKDMFFELIILIRGCAKKRGPVQRPPFFSSCPLMLFFGWEKKVNRFLRRWFCCEADAKIDDQASKNKDPLHRAHA